MNTNESTVSTGATYTTQMELRVRELLRQK